MEIQTTPWHETRISIPPQLLMIQEGGMIQYKASLLKEESPRTVTPSKRFVHFDANYVKYCFLEKFYQLLFDGSRQISFEGNDELTSLLTETVSRFTQHCRENPSEENARELFRTFCKTHFFGSAEERS
jgi:predicted TIM-barrel fold metal-dependent hydrolase